jgi:hypothetical protein
MGFAQRKEGESFALAMELMNKTPNELLSMDPLERQFAIALATQLEKRRWKNWGKLFGG